MQCAIIFLFLALGELTVAATGITIPSSIIGMLMLTASLKCGIIRIHQVDRISDFLVKNLGFFFVPAGVGLMRCLGLLRQELLPIVLATAVSTFVIIAVTGHIHQLSRRLTSRSDRHAPSTTTSRHGTAD
ncbi:MAG: CidA/LrgA family protein [Muribaculaceae bacterium]|nr:CidA/LrgA family protein [Muribaculaceae bacterium]